MSGYNFIKKEEFDFSNAPLYRKVAPLSKTNIEIAQNTQDVVTIINGQKETHNTANKGDPIITGVQGERYAIKAEDFVELYENDPENTEQYRSKNVIRAVQLVMAVEIMAPWGEKQRTEAGGFICQRVSKPSDIYLIERGAFEETYALIAAADRPDAPQLRDPKKENRCG